MYETYLEGEKLSSKEEFEDFFDSMENKIEDGLIVRNRLNYKEISLLIDTVFVNLEPLDAEIFARIIHILVEYDKIIFVKESVQVFPHFRKMCSLLFENENNGLYDST